MTLHVPRDSSCSYGQNNNARAALRQREQRLDGKRDNRETDFGDG